MSITLDQVTKRYQGSPVVNDVSVDVGEGEFFVLLGPSGSGKSTLLRAIAGLTGVDHGRIALHGRDVTHISARQRGVGLVFQNYALFRHMTVGDNIEFALRVRRMKAADRLARRKELLRLVALEGMDDRLPTQLSGGQQQRVAVARALAHKPQVLLLDEPFGALDAKIREELRRTIRQVQRELNITTVLVTHDQEEAFALADRIGVMNLGRLLECGKPDELYARPATRFVATFLGAANLLLARQTAQGIRFGATPVNIRALEKIDGTREHEVVAVLRPEEIELAPTRDNLRVNYMGLGVVEEMVFTGALERLRVRLTNGAAEAQITPPGDAAASTAMLEVTRTQHEQRTFPVTLGQSVALGVRRIHVLPTPLSSYTVCATQKAAAERLASHPFLTELASRMKTRIATRTEPALAEGTDAETPISGVAVVTPGVDTAKQIEWLLRNGAAEVLVLPEQLLPPQRVLIHWANDAARRPTLAVAASLLRHVSAEAVYVGILPEGASDTQRPVGMRTLLDARSEAQAMHGLEMRTELRFGSAAEELRRQLNDAPDQMLILGISDLADLHQNFAALFSTPPPFALMVVYRPAGSSGANER
ncbi:sulfate transport system ATP-binding protein [Povalibacter uvarum]|uniref:Sulfate transport system ATP-binding protein n=1 Tax=Povalibacter uvarum TaxID=732238 RepID=A0A841HJH3_9GAMM|nr:ABC transporter ATP-binding protein [Povalibacter uvarum]MBB6092873.1 sulfate transport system ATP-binding protein [Povalibacter uvarum]